MTITVEFLSKKNKSLLKKFSPATKVDKNTTGANLINLVSNRTGINASRVRLTTTLDQPNQKGERKVVLSGPELISKYAVDGSITVNISDMGPQIAWRTVFLIEYLGPLLIHPLFYFGREYIYGTTEKPSYIQTTVLVCVFLHFLKREYETAFVHKFSLATMPVFNLFKNCSHYWLLSGVLVAYFCYAPVSWSVGDAWTNKLYYTGGMFGDSATFSLILSWLLAEISNFIVHQNLASLRPAGSTQRQIPYGYGFNNLSCPNYFFEMWGWFSLTVFTGNWAMALFFVVGTTQMYFWAIKKHQRYLKEFPDYPTERKAMFPLLA